MARLVEILARELKEWPLLTSNLTQSAVDREIIVDDPEGTSLKPMFFASVRHDEQVTYPVVNREQWEAQRAQAQKGRMP